MYIYEGISIILTSNPPLPMFFTPGGVCSYLADDVVVCGPLAQLEVLVLDPLVRAPGPQARQLPPHHVEAEAADHVDRRVAQTTAAARGAVAGGQRVNARAVAGARVVRVARE